MHKSLENNSYFSYRGFTLIEILIVMSLIAIIATFVVMSTGDFGKSRREIAAIQEFKSSLSYAKQLAIFHPAIIGILFSKNDYSFYRYQTQTNRTPAKWLPFEDPSLKTKHFPASMYLKITVNQAVLLPGDSSIKPHIMISPSGEMTPFEIIFSDNQKIIEQISVNKDGKINPTNGGTRDQ